MPTKRMNDQVVQLPDDLPGARFRWKKHGDFRRARPTQNTEKRERDFDIGDRRGWYAWGENRRQSAAYREGWQWGRRRRMLAEWAIDLCPRLHDNRTGNDARPEPRPDWVPAQPDYEEGGE